MKNENERMYEKNENDRERTYGNERSRKNE